MGVRGKIEAVLYAAEEPVTLAQLAALFGEEALAESSLEPQSGPPAPDDPGADAEPDAPLLDLQSDDEKQQARAARLHDRARRDAVRAILDALIAAYSADERGMEIREIAGGFRVATKPEYHDAVRSFAKSLKPPMKLSLQALETLAVIAYEQPVTAPEVSEIRGVDSGGVLGSLIGRKLVTTAGRKQVLGRPILYKTTREFLLRFGLRDLNELPSMEEFEKMAGELRALSEEPEPQPPAPVEPAPLLEAPAEPELSIIVEDQPPEPAPGIQVQESGLAVSDKEAHHG